MKLTIERTEQFTKLAGVECRVWEGTAEDGTRCIVFVHRIAVHSSEDGSAFETQLISKEEPADWPGDLKEYLDTRDATKVR